MAGGLFWAHLVTAFGPVSGGPGDLLALATVAVAGLLFTLAVLHLSAVRIPETASAVRTVSLRQRARESAFLRLRDPDAAGRPRPRAPGSARRAV